MSAVATTCPFCACGCGLYLLANPGGLVGVAPRVSHPVSFGKLCARGWSAHEAALWGNRLTRPMVKNHGGLQPVSWSEALDCVAGRMQQLIDLGMPVGVLGSPRATNEENYLAGKLARAGLKTNNLDFSYHALCRSVFAGFEEACGEYAPTLPLHDIESSQTILLLEGDVARTHPRVAASVMKAVEKGSRLITLGCLSTQLTRLGSLHLPATPGGEGEVLGGLLSAVINLGLQDSAAVALHCEGFDMLQGGLAPAGITEEARQAVEWMARAERVVILMAPIFEPGDQVRKNAAALATLAAVTGHLGKPGSGILLLQARCNVRGACNMGVAPDRLPGYRPLNDAHARQRLGALWGRDLPSAPGLDAEQMIQSVSGLICVADDPPAVLPMGSRAMGPLAKIEFLVVLDSFLTPTARMAHVVLPIASFAETEGTFTNLEGRVQNLSAASDPPGEARSGWQVLAELGGRFGIASSYTSAAALLREAGKAAETRLKGEYEGEQKEGEALRRTPFRTRCQLPAATPSLTSPECPFVLAREGSYDWGRDPLVLYSPTLNRDYLSLQKLYPKGFIEICRLDADRLGVHAGRLVKLSSPKGKAIVPIRIRQDIKPGILLVPYAFRDVVSSVLGAEGATAVSVEQV